MTRSIIASIDICKMFPKVSAIQMIVVLTNNQYIMSNAWMQPFLAPSKITSCDLERNYFNIVFL